MTARQTPTVARYDPCQHMHRVTERAALVTDATDWMKPRVERPAPPNIDFNKPSIARVYDYVLGGRDNFEVDRAAASNLVKALPEVGLVARDNRAALRRAVRYLVEDCQIRQIIDIGSGLPTAGNVHEVAHEIDPRTRVVYVDIDPVVLSHGRALLADNETTTVITADVREPDSIFEHPTTVKFVNEAEPFAVLMCGILHHFADEADPWAMADAVRDRLPSDGYLMVGNFLDSGDPRAKSLEDGFLHGGLGTGRFRTADEQLRFFGDFELVDPGFVPAVQWRPDADTNVDSSVGELYAMGIGRKR